MARAYNHQIHFGHRLGDEHALGDFQ
jgi:hypothetical protein